MDKNPKDDIDEWANKDRMNALEEQVMQYEKDSIAYESGRSKVEPNNAMLISPNELLILLNIKNAEIARLNIVYQLAVAECNKSTGERNEARRQLQECRRERDERTAIIADLENHLGLIDREESNRSCSS
jgi:malic enzyme